MSDNESRYGVRHTQACNECTYDRDRMRDECDAWRRRAESAERGLSHTLQTAVIDRDYAIKERDVLRAAVTDWHDAVSGFDRLVADGSPDYEAAVARIRNAESVLASLAMSLGEAVSDELSAAIARAEAAERKVDELRAEIASLEDWQDKIEGLRTEDMIRLDVAIRERDAAMRLRDAAEAERDAARLVADILEESLESEREWSSEYAALLADRERSLAACKCGKRRGEGKP